MDHLPFTQQLELPLFRSCGSSCIGNIRENGKFHMWAIINALSVHKGKLSGKATAFESATHPCGCECVICFVRSNFLKPIRTPLHPSRQHSYRKRGLCTTMMELHN